MCLLVAVVAPFLLLESALACPVAAVASQLVLLLGLVLHGLTRKEDSRSPADSEADPSLTREQRDFRDRVEASRDRERELYRVIAKEPPSSATHDGLVYESPEGDPAVILGPRGLRQQGAWLLWPDVLDVGVVVDGAARLEVLTPDGIQALWLARPTRQVMAQLLWMVGEIRQHASARADLDEGEASEIPAALRRLQSQKEGR